MNVTPLNHVIEPSGDDPPAAEKNIFSEPGDHVRRVNNDPRARQPKPNNQPRRDKRDVHGWIVLDKPIGMTSTHAVAVVKRLF
ncbi:MAG TPA: tRNA pseudouridine(55) synthase TruB, partial [Bradyrhizobium sp.]|nr:tRNA pseudouridine(55) synthase TruB [Bradyrhizobium sp.]